MRSRALRRLSAERLPLISVIRGWDVKVGLARNEPSESELTVPGNEGLCECVSSGWRLSDRGTQGTASGWLCDLLSVLPVCILCFYQFTKFLLGNWGDSVECLW